MASAQASQKVAQGWMNSPAGPKTIFFWAPLFKWCLVAAGLKDINRPAENLSLPQNLALTATGIIWTRYSFVIYPVNYSLAAVNLFVGGTGVYQLGRIYNWRKSNPTAAAAKDATTSSGGSQAQKEVNEKLAA